MAYLSQVNVAGPILSASFSSAAGGDIVAVAAVTGKKIEVMRVFFANTGANSLTFKDGAGTSLTGVMDFGALAVFYAEGDNAPLFETSPGNAFIINASAATKVAGKIDYTLSP
jgi:hypothetical protein